MCQALFWNPFYSVSVQVLGIVAAQGGGQCSTIHTVIRAVVQPLPWPLLLFKQKVPKSAANDRPN